MRKPPVESRCRLGVFTEAEAVRDGWSPDALAWAVRAGRIERVRRGVYRIPAEPATDPFAAARHKHATETVGFLLRNQAAVASHASAAVLLDLPVLALPTRPCVTVAPGHTGQLSGAHVRRATLPKPHLADIGVPCTTVERTVVDLAREGGLASSVVTADAALHRDLTDESALGRTVVDCAGWPGLRAARAMLRMLDSRAESPLESLSRLRMRERRLPEPELRPVILDALGRIIARVDFYWDEGVVGEADGTEKYDQGFDAVRREKLRQERLEDVGLVVVRWGWGDLDRMDILEKRLRAAFARAGRRSAADRRWTARFRPRFVVPSLETL